MLGELIEVIKFIIEIVRGNIPGTQLYAMVSILVIVLIGEVLFELKKGAVKNIFLLVGERLILNIIGLVFYLGFYMFILKMFLKIWPTLIPGYETALASWLAIISYISIVLLVPLAVLFVKFNKISLKAITFIIHLIFTGVIISLINQYWEPNIKFPVILLIVNIVANTLLSLVIVTYELNKDEQKKTNNLVRGSKKGTF
ncbi:hypothetical protein GNE09_28425 (plasmid) [Bacillus cereus]|nr:hypothetical protein GNE09_28425 [Bacillus cereus]